MEQIGVTKLISVRDYAEQWGITPQAVWQSIKAKKNAEQLEGHLIRENGRILLDEEAVRILNDARNNNVVLVDSKQSHEEHVQELREKDARIADLEAQIRVLQQAQLNNSETIKSLAEDKRALEDQRDAFTKGQLLLEEKTEKIKQMTEIVTSAISQKESAEARAAAAEEQKATAEARATVAEQKLKEIKKAGFFARLRLLKEIDIKD